MTEHDMIERDDFITKAALYRYERRLGQLQRDVFIATAALDAANDILKAFVESKPERVAYYKAMVKLESPSPRNASDIVEKE